MLASVAIIVSFVVDIQQKAGTKRVHFIPEFAFDAGRKVRAIGCVIAQIDGRNSVIGKPGADVAAKAIHVLIPEMQFSIYRQFVCNG